MTTSIYKEPSIIEKLKGRIPKEAVSAGKAFIVTGKEAIELSKKGSKAVKQAYIRVYGTKTKGGFLGSPKQRRPRQRKPAIKTVYLVPQQQPYYNPPKQPKHRIEPKNFKPKSFWEKELG